ncbi:hydrogen peroxide-inducible genes activator [Methylomarinum vadi]|uniref:hydrogen peroxide-inducible genes activator n=1 Tax=Methylomarinum vadi TaxID=438855 RepID=UPI0004DF3720|nr:hydrogen peroxide-inducible genes activator [Methylomarinum vadi]
MKLPTVKQLRYLIALDEHRHFGKAARACHISQSGFSIAIKDLEALLGIRLVDRTNKSVTITALGKQVVAKARVCLLELENLVEIQVDGQTPLAGKFTLGVIPTVAPYLLPLMLQGLREKFPELKLFLKEKITPLLYDELLAGQVDLMLVALPYEFKHVEIMPLFKDRFFLAHHKQTRWLKKGNELLDQLREDSVLLLEDGHCLRDHALSACHLLHTDKINRFSGTSIHTLLQMVGNDLGVTFIPEMARRSLALLNAEVELQAMDEDSYREIGLVWRKNSSHDAEFRLLGEYIASCAANAPQ